MTIPIGNSQARDVADVAAAATRTPEVTPAVFDEAWASLHNLQIWRTGHGGTKDEWRNDATGYSYGD